MIEVGMWSVAIEDDVPEPEREFLFFGDKADSQTYFNREQRHERARRRGKDMKKQWMVLINPAGSVRVCRAMFDQAPVVKV